jgi:hypothetical protein
VYAIKTGIADPDRSVFDFVDQKTMYGGRKIAAGDTVYLFASENEGGTGLVARGVVVSSRPTPRRPGVARQTPRVSIRVRCTGRARAPLGRRELKPHSDWQDGRPQTELNFKLYRQATDKIVGLTAQTARFLDRFFGPRHRGDDIHADTHAYNARQEPPYRAVCDLLAQEIDRYLSGAENRVWHGHPVWFLDGNPIVGYSRQKPGIRLMFWSGADFDEPGLDVVGGKFKDASVFYNDVAEVRKTVLRRWLRKAREIQWDYKNLIRNKGLLKRAT